jgi:hypothetical protein
MALWLTAGQRIRGAAVLQCISIVKQRRANGGFDEQVNDLEILDCSVCCHCVSWVHIHV